MTESASVSMERLAEQIMKKVAGQKAELASIEDWGIGALNTCYRVCVKNPSHMFFLKVENENIIPSTRRGQIAREVHSIRLAGAVGIPCPVILAYDSSVNEFGYRYMLQEYIDSELLWCVKDQLTDVQNAILKNEILDVIGKMKSITSQSFGDVYENGTIGQYGTWKEAYRSMSRILLQDGRELGIFQGEEAKLVEETLEYCASRLVSPLPAALIHGDLGKHNVLADYNGESVKLRAVIDFGNAMFGPVYMNEDGIRIHGGWGLDSMNACEEYGIRRFEYDANNLIFSFEGAVFGALLSKWSNQDPTIHGKRFMEECRQLKGR
jgi:aminoglycoside phosphotransferase (APT) family kinase protein